MNTNHSPLPWRPYNASGSRVFKTWRIRGDADDSVIAIIPDDSRHSTERIYANAQYIVQACNAHPALVEALEDAADDFTDIRMILQSPVAGSANERLAAIEKLVNRSRDKRQAALALARGGKGGE